MKDGFKFSMIGDSIFEKVGLGLGEGHGDSLCFDFAGPAPVAWMVGCDASVGEPANGGKFLFKRLKAALEFLAFEGL